MLLLLALACADDDPPPDKIQVVTGPIVEHADASKGSPFDEVAFQCCDTDEASAVVGAFIGLGEALAADDEATSLERLGALRTAAPPGDVKTAIAGISEESMAGVREALSPLADATIAYAAAHKGGSLTMAVASCPMAPGHWLQVGREIRNPYYGAQMLKCGVFEALPE